MHAYGLLDRTGQLARHGGHCADPGQRSNGFPERHVHLGW